MLGMKENLLDFSLTFFCYEQDEGATKKRKLNDITNVDAFLVLKQFHQKG